jgi:hypothetical protein
MKVEVTVEGQLPNVINGFLLLPQAYTRVSAYSSRVLASVLDHLLTI